MNSSSARLNILSAFIAGTLLIAFSTLVVNGINEFWFNPRWTTDDAVQQIFPFHAVLHPHIFEGDLIYTAMKGYLAPLHLFLGSVITHLTQDPIMTGHWLMLIQVLITGTFIGLAIGVACKDTNGQTVLNRYAILTPALIGVLWLFHSQQIIQRMTAGLPRGWGAPIFAAYLYAILSQRHSLVIIILFIGVLLNPPATFLAGFAYSLTLLVRAIQDRFKGESRRDIFRLVIATPFLAALVLYVIHRPTEIGSMPSTQAVQTMPEFQKEGGRFAFLPFPEIREDLTNYGFRVFINKRLSPKNARYWVPRIALALVAAFCVLTLIYKRKFIPKEILIFGIAALTCYQLARLMAFKLYVPDRHLTIPLAFFFIIGFTVALWRLSALVGSRSQTGQLSIAWSLYLALSGLVYWGLGSGTQPGIKGIANFNYNDHQWGGASLWIKDNTPEDSLIGGHPTVLDPMQLFGRRKAFATSETWHPFYDRYNAEIERRLEISFRAHYASTLNEFISLLEPEGIDYFIFLREWMKPASLPTVGYFEPLNDLVHKLASKPFCEYAYFRIPKERRDIVPFYDRVGLLVDIHQLKKALKEDLNLDAINKDFNKDCKSTTENES